LYLLFKMNYKIYSQSNNTISHQNIKEHLKNLLNDRTHRYDNHHLQIYQHYVTSLLDQWNSNSFRSFSYLTLSDLIIFTMQAEYSSRSVFDHGDLHSEDTLFYKVYEKEFNTFTNYLNHYIEQSSENAPDADVNWSLYFLTEYIITEALYHQGLKITTDPQYSQEWFQDTVTVSQTDLLKEFYKVFYGLYPIISTDYNEIRSHIPMKYSSQYCYGFLLFPERVVECFPDNVYGYLHEIFHYIPPVSRTTRNHAALDLIVRSILSEWTNALSAKMSEHDFCADTIHVVCDCYFQNILEQFIGHIAYLKDKKYPITIKCNMISLDSMNLAILQSDFIYSTSDKDFVRLLLSTDLSNISLTFEENSTLNSILNNLSEDSTLIGTLRNVWKYEADSYATTYNTLLRELRSDINMVILLDMDLEKYIRTMTLELNFSTDNDKIIADTIILRFGFMTRFLSQYTPMLRSNFQPCTSLQEITHWEERCMQIFMRMQNEDDFDSTKSKRNHSHLNNIKSYIDIYKNVTIEQKAGYYTAPYHSLFETILAPHINQWKNDAEEMYSFPSFQFLRKIASKAVPERTGKKLYQYIEEISCQGLSAWNLSWPYSPFNEKR